MGGFGDAINNLYRQFLLRDVLSFVTPGAIVVLSVLLLYMPPESRLSSLFAYSLSFHWLLYIPLFGLFFMVGFAVQCFGEIIGLIRIHLDAKGCYRQRFKIFLCKKWDDKSNMWWKKAYEEVFAFYGTIEKNENERALIQRERLVVLKQMCANGFVATTIAGLLFIINQWCTSPWCSLIVIVPLLISLLWGYRVHELRLYAVEKASQGLPIDGKKQGS